MNKQNDISVIIVAKNDTEYLVDTINSVISWVKEIIVVDIGIQDEMVKKLKNLKVKLISYPHKVSYADQIRNKITNEATSKYVFFLDPDEIIPQSLQEYVIDNYQKYDAMSFPRKNIIFNKWIQHARWWPDYQLRLYNKTKGYWTPTIHSKPNIKGNVHEVEALEKLAFIHYNYKNMDSFLEKFMRYAKAEAVDYINSGKTFNLKIATSKGVQEFISRYFAGDGYKDGMHGFILSFLQSLYYPLVFFYYWEKMKYIKVKDEEIMNSVENYYKQLFLQSLHWGFAKGLKSNLSKVKFKLISLIAK